MNIDINEFRFIVSNFVSEETYFENKRNLERNGYKVIPIEKNGLKVHHLLSL